MLIDPPPIASLPAFKSLTSVQADPFQVSVFADIPVLYPPKTKPAVKPPPPFNLLLSVLSSAISDQAEPFQDSTTLKFHPGPSPPTAK